MPETTDTSVKVTNTDSWVKLMLGGGFAVAIGWGAFQYMTKEGTNNAEFQRTTVRESTAALTATAEKLNGMKDSLDGLVDKQTDLITELHPLTRNLDRLIDSVNDSVEQQKAAEAAKLERIAAKEAAKEAPP